jgi:hypothetical protein
MLWLGQSIVSHAMQRTPQQIIMQGNARIAIPRTHLGQMRNLITADSQIAFPAMRRMLQQIILRGNARIAIPRTRLGQMRSSTTVVSLIAFPAMQIKLQLTILQANARIAIIHPTGLLLDSIIQVSAIARPAILEMHPPIITLTSVPYATRQEPGLEGTLAITIVMPIAFRATKKTGLGNMTQVNALTATIQIPGEIEEEIWL